ncbi:MAG TPA: efflux RND transporter periplasmic adaptor subunit [Thermoanaerobaculia bacterium]|nr:efflux RND transporter periplasmic adaptor subunit [Thermoanaerobaculia bacterium]
MPKTRWFWIVAGVVVLVAAGGWLRIRKAHADSEVHYDTVEIDRGRIVAKVTATGTLSAIVTVQVGTQVSGTVASLYADFNSTVNKGQRIAKIDPALFEAAMQQARANLVAAEGNLAKAKAQAVDADRQAQRNAALLSRRLIAQADYDTAQSTADADRAAVDAAAGSVAQAKAQLHQANVNLAYTDITSPTNGTVIARNVDVGQTVAASLQAPTLFLIAEDLRKMQVDTSVAEADIGKITAGMRATFSVDAYPTERFSGTVRQVRNAPQTVQNVVTYDAVIDVDNSQLKLKPGMTANCTFVYAERDDALRVANSALRFLPPPALLAKLSPGGKAGRPGRRGSGGSGPASNGEGTPARQGRRDQGARSPASDRRTVWVLRDGQPKPVPIRIGVSDGSLTEVASGDLKAGDLVLTGVTQGGGAPAAQGAQPGNLPRRLF